MTSYQSLAKLFLFLSGAMALASEASYLHFTDLVFGSAPLLQAAIIATFIVGAGAGSYCALWVTRPWLVESALAVFNLTLAWGYQPLGHFFGSSLRGLAHPQAWAAFEAALFFIAPATVLGLNFPVLSTRLTSADRAYSWHNCGAFLGLILFETIGYLFFGAQQSLTLIAVIQLILAIALWPVKVEVGHIKLMTGDLIIIAIGVITGLLQAVFLFLADLLIGPFYLVPIMVASMFILGLGLGGWVYKWHKPSLPYCLRSILMGLTATVILTGLLATLPLRYFSVILEAILLGIALLPLVVTVGLLGPCMAGNSTDKPVLVKVQLFFSIGNGAGFLIAYSLGSFIPWSVVLRHCRCVDCDDFFGEREKNLSWFGFGGPRRCFFCRVLFKRSCAHFYNGFAVLPRWGG